MIHSPFNSAPVASVCADMCFEAIMETCDPCRLLRHVGA